MRCAKCQLEFCWICMGRYVGYRHDSKQDTMLCNVSHTFWFFTAITVGFVLTYRVTTLPFVFTFIEFVVRLGARLIVWGWTTL